MTEKERECAEGITINEDRKRGTIGGDIYKRYITKEIGIAIFILIFIATACQILL